MDTAYEYKLELDSNLPSIVSAEKQITLMSTGIEEKEYIKPSVEYDIPQNNDSSFRVDFPVYLEPGFHMVKVTRTSVIPVLHFTETETTLTITDVQTQQFHVYSMSKIRGVEFAKDTAAIIPTGTNVTFTLSINEGNDMKIHISEDYSLFEGITTNKAFDLRIGNILFY